MHIILLINRIASIIINNSDEYTTTSLLLMSNANENLIFKIPVMGVGTQKML